MILWFFCVAVSVVVPMQILDAFLSCYLYDKMQGSNNILVTHCQLSFTTSGCIPEIGMALYFSSCSHCPASALMDIANISAILEMYLLSAKPLWFE